MERNGRKGSLVMEPTERWTPQSASDLYDVASWGKGYFSVGENGHVLVHPEKDPARSIDLKQLVDTLVLRGIDLPILIRFADILKHRLGEIHSAFETAINEHKYQGDYCCVYPIKVNQQRQVVEEVLEFGKPFRFGLEAGSKPELMAVMALADNDTPIICNGFKDDEYIEMAMLAQKMGRKIIPVVEKYTELQLILKYSQRVGVRPTIGLRVKLASRGSGRWKSSGGYRSKFGLSVDGGDAGAAGAEGSRHGRLPQPAALPPGQPDHQYPPDQRRGERSRPRVRGPGARRRRAEIPGRGRRPGHRLRRFADRFRIERELHAAGVRQRHHLSRAERVR